MIGDSCVIGAMVDGNVCVAVQRMMGFVVHG